MIEAETGTGTSVSAGSTAPCSEQGGGGRRAPVVLFASSIFLSAFLLFEIEPVIAKAILPRFGGSSAVWSTCLLFFQVVLLAGYVYSHCLCQYLTARMQVWVHILLLAVSAAVFATQQGAVAGATVGDPVWLVLRTLGISIGLPYFLLSSTSPLMQAWYARTSRAAAPYRLYALSNVASVAALLAYPVLIEPYIGLGSQLRVWLVLYVVFCVLTGVIAWRSRLLPALPPVSVEETAAQAPPGAVNRVLWVLLPACASVMLLAITAYLTQDIASVPFLWVLPLCAYLMTFIFAFETPRFYNRAVFLPLSLVALAGAAYLLSQSALKFKTVHIIAMVVGGLFVLCMVCHGELVRIKPAPRYLTAFYVMMSIGGALGGIFVGLIAPRVFHWTWEMPIGLTACLALMVLILLRGYRVFFAPPAGKVLAVVMLVAVVGYGALLRSEIRGFIQGSLVTARNFYGLLRVQDYEDELGTRRQLVHGNILHGDELIADEHRRTPTTYYCEANPVGQVLKGNPSPQKVGLVGLGSGTLVAYGRPGDTYRVYEINPMVLKLAREQFFYLGDTQAKLDVVLGDARLSLQDEASQQFDVLAVDAFSGDSVPIHLLTREAFTAYFRHLKPGGVLAIHISNRYLDLGPVVGRAADSFGMLAVHYSFEAPEDDGNVCSNAEWVLITSKEKADDLPDYDEEDVLHGRADVPIWTDDFSSLWKVLR